MGGKERKIERREEERGDGRRGRGDGRKGGENDGGRMKVECEEEEGKENFRKGKTEVRKSEKRRMKQR